MVTKTTGSGMGKLMDLLNQLAIAQAQINMQAQAVTADVQFSKRLIDAANKRLNRLVAAGHAESDFISRVLKDGKFSVRGKTGAAREVEIARVLNFMRAEQSTLKGAKAVVARAANSLG
ncbi:hypothetical protein, partial [Herbiconiux daphne]